MSKETFRKNGQVKINTMKKGKIFFNQKKNSKNTNKKYTAQLIDLNVYTGSMQSQQNQ